MKRKAEQILKVDVIGRVWTPRGQREAVLDEFERSGMPGTKFAEHIGVERQGTDRLFAFESEFSLKMRSTFSHMPGRFPGRKR